MTEKNRRLPPVDLRDGLALIGLGAMFYGAWLIYKPAAFILVGVLVFWLATRI